MRSRHCVVVGGIVAGLLAAAALSSGCESVTIVEKDDLPAEPVHRRAVGHGLPRCPCGCRTMRSLTAPPAS
jgi:NADPH-dependent 2,4-dienoyl-CoA reductase/sulfur reductase-like enzyme